MLLIVRNAAKATSGFKGVRGQMRGPVNKLIQRVVERGKALVVFTSEFEPPNLTWKENWSYIHRKPEKRT